MLELTREPSQTLEPTTDQPAKVCDPCAGVVFVLVRRWGAAFKPMKPWVPSATLLLMLAIGRVLVGAEPGPEQSEQIKAKAASLNGLAVKRHGEGKYAEATDLLNEALQLRRKLYPPERYPDGHLELATTLNNLAAVYKARGDYQKAEPLYHEALDSFRKLCPPGRYPDGHTEFATTLHNLAALYRTLGKNGKAEPLFREALDMRRKLYSPQRYPTGHPDLAISLNHLALLLEEQAEYDKAEPLLREALDMRRRLYPTQRYPDGHPDLAGSLNNLAGLHLAMGEHGKAEPFYQEALQLKRKLYPPQRYPDGHPDLATSIINLAYMHEAQRDYGRAEPLYLEALGMTRKLYPPERFPNGHPLLAASLNNLAALHRVQGDYGQAELLHREALECFRRLYPPQRYPDGHPDLARSLNNLALSYKAQGEYARAEPFYREALAMKRKLYPPERYPTGHPDLAVSLRHMGAFYSALGEYGKAEPLYREALLMDRAQLALYVAHKAEAEALNLIAAVPSSESGLLGASAHTRTPAAELYPLLWRGKGAVAQVLQRRQQALALTADPQTLELAEQLRLTRQRLAAALLAPRTPGRESAESPSRLSEVKEDLERRLAARLPAVARHRDLDQLGPADLARRLPQDGALLDVYRYFHRGKGEASAWHYAVFVLAPQQPIQRVEIEDAATVEVAWSNWRQAITRGQDDAAAAATLRMKLWQPLAAALPAGTRRIYLAPEGPITGLPWGALPGDTPGSVLLEQYAFAVVPSATFLLDRLTPDPERQPAPPSLLAVGGVDYARPPQPAANSLADAVVSRAPPQPVGQALVWPSLPGTATEQRQVVELARRTLGIEAVSRTGAAAGVAQVLADLRGVRYAHLATHGFFADPQFRSVLQVDEKVFAPGLTDHRQTAGRRNPLVLSGLVLAGANRADSPEQERGLLTAEMIAGQPLEKLYLAVLSACDTGLGEGGGGEGVFGLQRAFHLAGAENVVASLWQVGDEATAALMTLFYRFLWEDRLPPLEALRQAQLAVYRHPAAVGTWAKGERGPNLKARPATNPGAQPAAGAPSKRAPFKQWAAFVLSGTGR